MGFARPDAAVSHQVRYERGTAPSALRSENSNRAGRPGGGGCGFAFHPPETETYTQRAAWSGSQKPTAPPEMFQGSSWDPGPRDGPGNQTDLVSSPLRHMAAVVLGQVTEPPLSPSFLLGLAGGRGGVAEPTPP